VLIKAETKSRATRAKEDSNSGNMDFTAESAAEDEDGSGRFRFWKTEAFKAKEKELRYKYVKAGLRKEFLSNMVERICRFRNYNSIIPEGSHSELGRLIVYLLRELLKIENKYGYKVPLLIAEHQTTRKNDQVTMTGILRLNEHFLATLIPKLERSEDMFVHMERSVPTIIEPLPWL
jgi:hypothetical protein